MSGYKPREGAKEVGKTKEEAIEKECLPAIVLCLLNKMVVEIKWLIFNMPLTADGIRTSGECKMARCTYPVHPSISFCSVESLWTHAGTLAMTCDSSQNDSKVAHGKL